MTHFHFGRPVVVTLALAMFLGTLPACVSTSDFDRLRSQVYYQEQERKKNEERIAMLESEISRSKPAQANSWAEVDSMRAQVAALHGKVDDLQRSNAATSSSGANLETLSAQVADLQRKNQVMASQLGVTFEESGTPSQPAPFQSQAEPSTTPQAVGPAPTPAPTAPAATPPAKTPAVSANPGQELYQQALAAFEAKKYKQAQGTWNEFVKGFPKDPLVPNALFWQGESFFQLQDYANAVLAYQKVIEGHSKSDKYRAATLKQGMAFYKLKKDQAGKLVLEDLIKKAPDSPEAKRAQAFLKNPN